MSIFPNNSSQRGAGGVSGEAPLVSDEIYSIFRTICLVFVIGAFGVLGIFSNSVNLTVFFKQGLKDSVSVQLTLLSAVDFSSSCIALTIAVLEGWKSYNARSRVDILSLIFFTGPLRACSHSMSTACVAFLSVERSFCVLFPLHFKTIFTKPRVTASLVVMLLVTVLLYAPNYTFVSFVWLPDARYNTTRLFMIVAPEYNTFLLFEHAFLSAFVPVAVQILLVISAVIMTSALRKSVRFRQTTSGSNAKRGLASGSPRHGTEEQRTERNGLGSIPSRESSRKCTQNGTNITIQPQENSRKCTQNDTRIKTELSSDPQVTKKKAADNTDSESEPDKPAADDKNRLGARERRVVQMVVCVAALFMSCNLAQMLVVATTIVKEFLPEFSLFHPGRYQKLVMMIYSLQMLSQAVNSSLNIFIYYRFNSAYRSTFRQLFERKKYL